ncbi:MAG: menaquinone biosynthetic enzyme MqnA/MqnD family protein [Blastocatellia bacterium]
MTLPYIAASSYLNTAPLCYSFLRGRQKDFCHFLSDRAPARCAEMLVELRVDAALIPVIEYPRIPGLKVIPGPCVASRGKVQSVVLASKVPIRQVTRVALDVSSRTSAALIKIILERFYRLTPQYQESVPDINEMLRSNDAALIIGDPAILIDRSALNVYDMAEEWRSHTGLPFVFAFWVVRQDSPHWGEGRSQNLVDFVDARREGLAHLDEIASDYSASLGLPREDLINYLTKNISFDLDAEGMKALQLFFQLAHNQGLIDRVVEPVFQLSVQS